MISKLFPGTDVFSQSESILRCTSPVDKSQSAIALHLHWCALDPAMQLEQLSIGATVPDIGLLADPGRPEKPELVDARLLPRRGIGSMAGRIALLHSLAHIEFNAINLALDAVWRFRDMPVDYVSDWLRVASDEGKHFMLLFDRLHQLGSEYGAFSAHNGLWEMAMQTAHDVLVRMALVPRILEARGLDVAPPMIEKLRHSGDDDSAAILQRIYTDEITHVAVGNCWFRYICEKRDLDGTAVFRDLLKGPNSAWLRSPYNIPARLEAGFTEAELELIQEMEEEYRIAMG
ncbi:MAG: ferritin-like domain-containing protein [Granulosicoccus sp.]